MTPRPAEETNGGFVLVLGKLSLVAAVVLILGNQFVQPEVHGWLSSLPLLLGGAAYALLQIRLKPSRNTVVKRLLLAGAFIAWGIDQILPAGRIATFLGDAVIAAYVLDLYWMSADQRDQD